jgi:E-phenylitaconyl-CoA hydratase
MAVRFELPTAHPGVALVTIDRPEQANSLDPPSITALADAWRRVRDDTSIRAAVLTGAGERVFCGGMDMKTRRSQRCATSRPRSWPGSTWENPSSPP